MTAEDRARQSAALQTWVAGRALAFGEAQAVDLQGVEWTAVPGVADAGEPLARIEDESVDAVLSVFALENCLDPYACLQQWSRILRDGGNLAVLARVPADQPAGERHSFAPSYLIQLVNLVGGFLIDKVEEIRPGQAWLLTARRSVVAGVRIPLGTLGPDLARRANRTAAAKAELYFQLGTVLLQAADPGLAETCFRQAMSIEGTNPEVLFGLGMSACAQGRWSEALVDLKRVVALAPENAEARRWVALAEERAAGIPPKSGTPV